MKKRAILFFLVIFTLMILLPIGAEDAVIIRSPYYGFNESSVTAQKIDSSFIGQLSLDRSGESLDSSKAQEVFCCNCK